MALRSCAFMAIHFLVLISVFPSMISHDSSVDPYLLLHDPDRHDVLSVFIILAIASRRASAIVTVPGYTL